jgi:hypothetical protein
MSLLLMEEAAVTAGSSTAQATGTVALRPTPEVDLLVRRAAWIGQGDSDNLVVSFTSLFLSFLASTDGVSMWVQDKVTWIGPALADVVRRWNSGRTVPRGLDEKRVQAARTRTDKQLPEAQAISSSASRVMAAARDLARRVGSDTLDVHHVFAVYVYAPPGHGDDLKAWGLDREAWAARFRCHVTAIHPEEAAAWRRLHDDSSPTQFSVGVREMQRWATPIAARASAASIDSRALLCGILLDGLAYSGMKYASVQLVEYLGGRATVEALIATEQASERSDLDAVLPLSDEVQPIFDRALLFATAIRIPSNNVDTGANRVLHVRHVISALLTDRRALAASELVRRARRTQEGLLAQFRRWLDSFDRDTATDGSEDADVRRRIFDELRDDVLAGYDNDEAHGEDRLNIGPDVRALAAVLASTQVAPPISVGLFGDWGSGKSFFMRKLRERIAQLADAARAKPAAESWFCGGRGRVVQIEFNAWHYMDANLWSSLAVRVFDTLSDEFQGEFARACLRQLDSLKEREAELQAAHGQLTAAEAALDQRLAEQRALRAKRTLDLGSYVEVIVGEVAREVAADPRVKAVTERLRLQGKAIETELHLIKGDLETAGGSARRWWQTLRSPGRLITLGLVLVAPVIIGAIASAYVAAGSATATSVATLVVAIAAVGSQMRQGARQLKGLLGEAFAEVDRIEAKARAKKAEEERQVELDREQISTRISELEREQLQLSKQRADLEAQICLAIVVGNPTFGAELFGQILSRKLQSEGELVKWCGDRAKAAPGASARDSAAIREIVARSAEFAEWDAVCDAVGRVARFSFETGRILGFRMLERSVEHEQRSS